MTVKHRILPNLAICLENNIEKIKIIVKLTITTLNINDTKQNYKCNDYAIGFPPKTVYN